jgi:hypothetical protein
VLEDAMTWILGATLAALFSTALLTIPALLAVRHLVTKRVAAPFERDGLERHLVLFAGVLGSLGALAVSDGCALYADGSSEMGTLLGAFIAPVPLAAVPWTAGELLSGASLRPFRSFVAASLVSSAISWAGYALLWAGQSRQALTPLMVSIQLALLFLSSHFAARTYLALRGEPLQALPPAALALERI